MSTRPEWDSILVRLIGRWSSGFPCADDGETADGVVFEVGEGPRGENDRVTTLLLHGDRAGFELINQPSGTKLFIPSDPSILRRAGQWTHLAFTYESSPGLLRHFVDGREQASSRPSKLRSLEEGEEAYFSLLRDGTWNRPLPGAIDEFRVARGRVYVSDFDSPQRLVDAWRSGKASEVARVTQPLLFVGQSSDHRLIDLGGRKHLMIDDVLFPVNHGVTFRPVPPERVELVFEVEGSFRKHLTVIEDEEGIIRIYNPIGRGDRLGVRLCA